MDYYQILGVPRDVGRNGLHRAFRELSLQAHPDRFAEHERERAEKRYRKIVMAFNTLKDPRLREQYDRNMGMASPSSSVLQQRAQPQDPFEDGLLYYRQREWVRALACFNKALLAKPGAESYFYKGLAENQIPELRGEGVKSLQMAVAQNPKNLQYLCRLVAVLHDLGMLAHARTAVNNGLRHFPDHAELIALQQKIDPPKNEKNRFLGGLFGRR